jgi:membrane dipeptidase
VFYPAFTDPVKPTLERVADHLEYMASKCGKAHVGIASDFGGSQWCDVALSSALIG